jgi:ribokinase
MGVAEPVDVVVAGAINTDLVAVVERAPEAGETVTGMSFTVFGGGKGANQAVAARRAGARVAMVGATGDDAFGAERRSELAAEGIVIDGIAELGGMTSGVALITVEPEGENRIAYVPGPTLKITGEQVRERLELHRPSVYLQPNEVPTEVAGVALRAARMLGATTMLNAAPDPATVRSLVSDVDVLIVNEVEAFSLVGHDGPLDVIAEALANEAATTVVLTAGARGVYAVIEGAVSHLPAPRVDVVDTTGAGDTFCGALAAGVARGVPFLNAVGWSVHAASLATTVAGAQPSIPTRQAVDDFMAARS